jgi:hypothetical protein
LTLINADYSEAELEKKFVANKQEFEVSNTEEKRDRKNDLVSLCITHLQNLLFSRRSFPTAAV